MVLIHKYLALLTELIPEHLLVLGIKVQTEVQGGYNFLVITCSRTRESGSRANAKSIILNDKAAMRSIRHPTEHPELIQPVLFPSGISRYNLVSPYN